MVDQLAYRMGGFEELEAALTGLGPEVATKLGVQANRKAANFLKEVWVLTAPRNPQGATEKHWRTKSGQSRSANYGQLYQNIRVRRVRARLENNIVFNVTTGRAFWGFFLEFGTSKMAAQPWARPALDASAERTIDQQADHLRDGIERYARRVKKGKA